MLACLPEYPRRKKKTTFYTVFYGHTYNSTENNNFRRV